MLYLLQYWNVSNITDINGSIHDILSNIFRRIYQNVGQNAAQLNPTPHNNLLPLHVIHVPINSHVDRNMGVRINCITILRFMPFLWLLQCVVDICSIIIKLIYGAKYKYIKAIIVSNYPIFDLIKNAIWDQFAPQICFEMPLVVKMSRQNTICQDDLNL